MGIRNSCCFKRKDFRLDILMLGLNGSGKTGIVNSLSGDPAESIRPTFAPTFTSGTNLSRGLKGVNVGIWEFSGDERFRHDWSTSHLVQEVQAFMFVVDSFDVGRITEARQYLFTALQSPKVMGLPVLILANKQDLSGALSPQEVAEKFSKLLQHTANPCQVHGASAVTGVGLRDAISTLADMAKSSQRN